jgi:NADH-quinone oxidoreductase subunit N
MTGADFIALLPLLVLGSAAVFALLGVGLHRHPGFTAGVTIAGLLGACAALPAASSVVPRTVTPLLVIDRFALFYMGMLAFAALAVVGMSQRYLRARKGNPEEFYILLLVATLGASVLVASRHFASLFLGMETLSVSLYGMLGYLREQKRSTEAGVKYLILAAAASAFLILGMALVYAESGSLLVADIGRRLASNAGGPYWIAMGVGLILVGIGFKLAAVPFHMWTADVYEGAPAPAGAFIATVSKGAVLCLLIRYFVLLGAHASPRLMAVIVFMAAASMFVGNLLALLQHNVKRILAYSSIANMGYMLVAFVAAGPLGAEAVTFYLVAYFATILAAFGVITVLTEGGREPEQLEEYRALLWRRPWLGAVLAAALLSLAGIPLTAGFFGKYYLLLAATSVGRWTLAIILVVNSALSLYYYLRILVVMAAGAGEHREAVARSVAAVGVLAILTLASLTGMLVWLGVAPNPILDLIRPAAATLVPGIAL